MIKLEYRLLRDSLVISSKYGIREYGGLEFHPGIDYKAPLGTPIYAVDNGFVAVTGNDPPGYGLYVVLDHGHYCTLYAHLRGHILKTGQLIKAGDVVGYVGLTGMTTGPHLHFEIRDCPYSDKNFWLKSYLKGRHVMCIDPEKLVAAAAKVPETNVKYSKTTNGTYQLCGDVKDLNVKIVNQKNQTIEEPYCVNGTFFWWEDTARTKTYPTSILYANDKLYQAAANHLPYPQSVFIVNKDNAVEMKQIKNIAELDLDKVKIAIGGVGLRNTLDSSFVYNPAAEGFKGAFEDVLRKANKTVIGYNAKQNKIYLLVRPNIYHKHTFLYDLLKLVKDCEYDIALSLDGGGSTFMNNADEMVVFGDNRRIHNIIGFGL